jgi:tetratricopeptide (TPR) repeat protein
MKKVLLPFLAISLFLAQPVVTYAQTQKEIQQQMRDAVNDLNKQVADLEKRIADAKKNKDDAESIKSMEEEMAMLKKQVALMGGLNKDLDRIPGFKNEKPKKNPFVGKGRFPERKSGLLASLPDGTINKQELITFLTATNTELKKKIPAEKVKNAESILAKMKGDGAETGLAGVMAWYSNSPLEALLIITYASIRSPDDNTLNNCSALFNLCGLEDRAVPVLKYVLAHDPNNSTVLNNLGQAYAGLGDLNTSMNYLRAAMVNSPSHPEACATAAYIEAERGNTAEAVKLMSKALQTGYSEARVKFIDDIDPNNSLPRFTMSDLDLRNAQFFKNDFSFPPNCRDWRSSEDVYNKQQEFGKIINALAKRYSEDVLQNSMVTLTKTSPFNEAVYYKMKQIGDDYEYRVKNAFEMMMSQVNTITENSNLEREASDKKFTAEYKACEGTSNQAACMQGVTYRQCKDRQAIEEKYFSALADVSDNYKAKRLPLDMEYTNKMIWLMSLRSTDDRFLKAETGTAAVHFLNTIKTYILSTCNPVGKPNCEQLNPANPDNPNSPQYKKANCPFNIIVPAGPLKMNLNCSQFKIDITAGVAITYEKDFISKESTIAVGAGASVGPKVVELGAKAQVYVKFDGNNQPIDAGVQAEVELEIVGPVSPIVKAGFTAGVNSGINPTGQLSSPVNLSTFSWK